MSEYFEMLGRAADFKGITRLTECWVALLFDLLLGFAGMLLFAALKMRTAGLSVLLFMLLPLPALAVRRIRSSGRCPWNALWGLLPVAGILILTYYMALPDADN